MEGGGAPLGERAVQSVRKREIEIEISVPFVLPLLAFLIRSSLACPMHGVLEFGPDFLSILFK